MEVADMDLYLVQSFIEEFINVYSEQFDELVSCISKIKEKPAQASLFLLQWRCKKLLPFGEYSPASEYE